MCSPFFDRLSLRISDGNANLSQYLSRALADCCSQRPYRSRGIKVKDRHEIFMSEVPFRFQSATGHESVGNADCGCGSEPYSDVKFIIFFQERTINDIEYVLLVLGPVCVRQLSGHTGQLFCQITPCHFIAAFQHGCDQSSMFFFQCPQPGSAGVFPCAGVRNIKHIAQTEPVPGIVHQGNALGAAPNISAHPIIPQVILSAGSGTRTLGVNHHLLMEWILIEAGGGGKKARPLLPAAGELDRYFFRYLRVLFSFRWHGFLSSLLFLDKEKAGNLAKDFPPNGAAREMPLRERRFQECHNSARQFPSFTHQNPDTVPAQQTQYRSWREAW